MKEIELTKGKVAIVDDEIFKNLNKYKWQYGSDGYASRNSVMTETRTRGKRFRIFLHREILNIHLDKFSYGQVVDHIDGNKLNNCINNLRIVDQNLNIFNQQKRKDNKSGYPGIYKSTKYGKWGVARQISGKKYWCGFYINLDQAIDAWHKISRLIDKSKYKQ